MRTLLIALMFFFCTIQASAYEYKSMIATQAALIVMQEVEPEPTPVPKPIGELPPPPVVQPTPKPKYTPPSKGWGFFRRR